jgi:hypothetical protein
MIVKKFWALLAVCAVVPLVMAASGFPSRPRFQSVGINTTPPATAGDFAISGSMTGGAVPDARLSANVPLLNAQNTFVSSGGSYVTVLRNSLNTGYVSMRLFNDQNSSVRALEFDYSGSSYAASLLTGGPTGESASITTTGNFPLSIGTSNSERIRVDGVGASINLKATVVNANGISVANCAQYFTLGGAGAGAFSAGDCPISATSTSRVSAGLYQYNFTMAGVTSNITWSCMLRNVSVINTILNVQALTTSSVTIQTIAPGTGLATDTSGTIACIVHM